MVLKPDQQHIKELLTETITLLCCNGLHFKSEFSIDGLIGITLDQDNVFLISIKETFHNKDGACTKSKQQVVPHKPNKSPCSSPRFNANLSSSGVNDGRPLPDPESQMFPLKTRSVPERMMMAKGFGGIGGKQPRNKRKHRVPLKIDSEKDDSPQCLNQERYFDGGPAKKLMLDSSLSSIGSSDVPGSENHGHLADNSKNPVHNERPRLKAEISNLGCVAEKSVRSAKDFIDESGLNCEQAERGEICDGVADDVLFIKQEPVEKSLRPVMSRAASYANLKHVSGDEFNTVSYQSSCFISSGQLAISRFSHPQEVAGCSSWNFPDTPNAVQLPFSVRSRCQLEPVESHASDSQVEAPSDDIPPLLTAEELAIARAILSMRGNFVSLGCLKANRQCLRTYTREHLIAVMEKISSPLDPSLFIGSLYAFGPTRVFFKCPPSQVAAMALEYFGFDPVIYSENYHEAVIVDKNIRDRVAWIEKILDKSPFK